VGKRAGKRARRARFSLAKKDLLVVRETTHGYKALRDRGKRWLIETCLPGEFPLNPSRLPDSTK
jgi:hypothetical protein